MGTEHAWSAEDAFGDTQLRWDEAKGRLDSAVERSGQLLTTPQDLPTEEVEGESHSEQGEEAEEVKKVTGATESTPAARGPVVEVPAAVMASGPLAGASGGVLGLGSGIPIVATGLPEASQ